MSFTVKEKPLNMIVPRLIRNKHAPFYCGMDKSFFDSRKALYSSGEGRTINLISNDNKY